MTESKAVALATGKRLRIDRVLESLIRQTECPLVSEWAKKLLQGEGAYSRPTAATPPAADQSEPAKVAEPK